MKWIWASVFCLAATTTAFAGQVKTLDGHTYPGVVRFDQGQLTVKNGDDVTPIDPAQIDQANFSADLRKETPVIKPGPADAAPGHGWSATYFADQYLAVPVFSQIDSVIDFDWRQGKLDPRLSVPFSGDWIANLTVPRTDNYRFSVTARDGVRFTIGDKAVVDHWHDGNISAMLMLNLQEGKTIPLHLSFFNATRDAKLRLTWSSSKFENQSIPIEYLTPATPEQRRRLLKPHGLRGEYFEDDSFKVLKLRRHDANVDFRWNKNNPLTWPSPQLPERFGARWTGRLLSPGEGQYTLFFDVDDLAKVFIDDKPIIDCWNQHSGEYSAPFTFHAGQSYDLKIEYSNRFGQDAAGHFAWAGGGRGKKIIDPSYLSPPPGDPLIDPQVVLHQPEKLMFQFGENIVLTADASAEADDHIKRVEFLTGDVVIGTADQSPFTLDWKNPPIGRHEVVAVAIDEKGFRAKSGSLVVTVANKAPDILGEGWMDFRVGDSPSQSDSTSVDGTACTVSAGAGDVWSNNDSFHYLFHQLEGDGSLTAQINSVKGSVGGNLSCAGLMIRKDLTPTSAGAGIMLLNSPAASIVFLHRDWTGADLNSTANVGKTPTWFRIDRTGKHVKTFNSLTGEHWNLIGETDLQTDASVFIGLAVAAKGDGSSTAIFDHVELKNGQSQSLVLPSGIETLNGSILTGDVLSADTDKVRLRIHNQNLDIAPAKVAAFLFRPTPVDAIQGLPPGKRGVLLSSGDFADGDFTEFTNGRIALSSVLFGKQSFGMGEATALLLNDVAIKPGYVVTATDGSMYRIEKVKIENGKLHISDSVAGELALGAEEIKTISKTASP